MIGGIGKIVNPFSITSKNTFRKLLCKLTIFLNKKHFFSIEDAIRSSDQELSEVNRHFEDMESQYQKVLNHIASANDLGTTKSSMFEDMDNMLSQIKPMVNGINHN